MLINILGIISLVALIMIMILVIILLCWVFANLKGIRTYLERTIEDE